jgi:hypothetical protein
VHAIKLASYDERSFEQGKKSQTKLTRREMCEGREVLLRLEDVGSKEFRGEERRAVIEKVEARGHVTKITFRADPLPGEPGRMQTFTLRVNSYGELLTESVRGTQGRPADATNPEYQPPKLMRPSRVCGYAYPFRRQLMLAAT